MVFGKKAKKDKRFVDAGHEGLIQSKFAVESDENEGAPAWVVSYSDMVTLLLTFFVLLFAIGETEQEKFQRVVVSLRDALKGTTHLDHQVYSGNQDSEFRAMESNAEQTELNILAAVKAEMEKIIEDLQRLIESADLSGQITAEMTARGAIITISDVAVFPIGKAQLTQAGRQTMQDITQVLLHFPYHVKIEGHTDNTPINTREFPSNWELATRRASEIVRFLIDAGVSPDQLSAEGFAEYHPVATNFTSAGRAKNRRVELVISQEDIERNVRKEMMPSHIVAVASLSSP